MYKASINRRVSRRRTAAELPRRVCTLLLCLLPALAPALPEDREQEVVVDADHSDLYIDEGTVVHHGSAEQPAVITQGTLRVAGDEITIETRDEEATRITAVGSPARFQQQPAADKGIVHASGRTLIYDNINQLLTVEGDASFRQDGNTVNARRIEYDMQAGRATASGGEDGERVRMRIPPQESSP